MASKMITLNVGGTIYTTSIETLTRYPDSMLGAMFRTQHGDSESQLDPSNKDENGRFVIDRDGPMFRYVLNFLRESSLTLPEDFKELGLLRREAEFYQIQPLIEAVDMTEPKSSCKMEWVKVVNSVDDYSWTIFGKQEILDQFTVQQTKRYKWGRHTPHRSTLRLVPRDISITVKLVDVVLGTFLRENSDTPMELPDDIRVPLYDLGFVWFGVTHYGQCVHLIFVHRIYPD